MHPLLARFRQTIAASGPSVLLLTGCTEPVRDPGHPSAPATTSPATTSPAASTRPSPAPTVSAAPVAAAPPEPPDMEPPLASLPASWGCDPATGACSCFPPRSMMHSSGMTAHPEPPFQHHYDRNGCAPMKEVTNGCCNPASKGPVFVKNQCCYQFDVGPCCGRPLRVGVRDRVASLVSHGGGWG